MVKYHLKMTCENVGLTDSTTFLHSPTLCVFVCAHHAFFFYPFSIPGIDLENIVYYKDDTHYFVMTAKKKSLLKKGVIKQVTKTHRLPSKSVILISTHYFGQQRKRNKPDGCMQLLQCEALLVISSAA